jgi:hypothetical protein
VPKGLTGRTKFPLWRSLAFIASGLSFWDFDWTRLDSLPQAKQDRESGLKNLDDLDDVGRSNWLRETPIFIGLGRLWTIWTTLFYSRDKNSISKGLLMRAMHSNDPGQPCL